MAQDLENSLRLYRELQSVNFGGWGWGWGKEERGVVSNSCK